MTTVDVTEASPVSVEQSVTFFGGVTSPSPATTRVLPSPSPKSVMTSVQSSPFTLGTPVITQLSSLRSSNSPISSSSSSSSSSSPPAVSPVPAFSRTGKAVSNSGLSQTKGIYQFGGKNYLLSWRIGRNNFDWNSGVTYCESQGMVLSSLDNKDKLEHFLGLVQEEGAPYFWTGGQVSPDSRTLHWHNGGQEVIVRGQHPWSFTGRTGPQPDGGERCVAVLNNVYRDGVKFHDVSCHHRKPVVCEQI